MEFLFIFIPVFIGLIIFGAIYSHKKEKERRAAMAAWAAERNLYFSAEKVRGFDDEYPEFDCLRQGSGRYAYNIIAGKLQGWEVKLFDYHYETHSTNSKGHRQTHHHYFSAVIVESPFPLLALTIRPEHVFHKLSAAFGWDDINFESAEFSRKYHVKAEDKRWAYDVIHAPVIEMLLGINGYSFESNHRAMICSGGKGRHDLETFERSLWLVIDILDQIPDHAKERAAIGG